MASSSNNSNTNRNGAVRPKATISGSSYSILESPRNADDEFDACACGEVTPEGLDLSYFKRFAVGSAHILNDLGFSLWFMYLLLYFENVVGLSSKYAAYLMLLGQVTNAVLTPLVGYEVDQTTHFVFFRRSYGRCKTWHLFGVIFVTLSYPFIFTPCIGCGGAEDWAKLIYYAPFIVISQIGACALQIAHLALIPKMSPNDLIRTELLSIRYGFAVLACITIFVLTWQSFGYIKGSGSGLIDNSYASSFRNVTFMGMGIGLVFSILFHIFVHEHTDDFTKKCVALSSKSKDSSTSDIEDEYPPSDEKTGLLRNRRTGSISVGAVGAGLGESGNSYYDMERERNTGRAGIKYSLSTKCLSLGREHLHMKSTDWLKLGQFYGVALIYMMCRLSVGMTHVYIALYLQHSLQLPPGAVATVPLTMFLVSFVGAIFVRPINSLVGRQFSYIFGALLITGASVCILVLDLEGGETDLSKYGTYGVAALLGAGAPLILITSSAIAADLIGSNVESSAFVFSVMSFMEKISCGLAVVLINSSVPCLKGDTSLSCTGSSGEDLLGTFYQRIMAFASAGFALGGVVGVTLITCIIFVDRFSQPQPQPYQFTQRQRQILSRAK